MGAPGPLHGCKIVEFDGLGPVPFCAMLLAGLGADILRIARAPASPGLAAMGDAILHRGRPVVTADLKSPADRDAVLRLIGAADALIEGYRPGVMERLGLGPAPALAANPRLVYGRMTGWGQVGPLAPRAGHDINYIAIAGALHAIGRPDEPPAVPLNLIGDYGGGAMFLATGVLAALLEAQKSGQGQVVDATMTDGAALLMSLFQGLAQAGQWRDDRQANLLDGGRPFYRCYECADARHVAVGALEPQFFATLLRITGIDFPADRQHDPAEWPRLTALLEAAFKTRARDEWTRLCETQDSCVSPVLSLAEAPAHPHHQARGTFVRQVGVLQAVPAPRFSRSGQVMPDAPPVRLDLARALALWPMRRS
jgi:alpha-methylacyl-CoA racemase